MLRGAGTRFPLYHMSDVSRSSQSSSQSVAFMEDERIGALRILIADPYAQLREIIRDILLRGIGVQEVVEARNGEEALTMLRDLSCDIAILDCAMQPMGGVEGQATDIEISAKHILQAKDRLAKILAKNTGRSMDQINKDMDRDYWFTPEEAKKYGLIDKIYKPKNS